MFCCFDIKNKHKRILKKCVEKHLTMWVGYVKINDVKKCISMTYTNEKNSKM